ncbi:MAG: hypothetical protein ACJAUP_000425 [Cellvibrionaceae bacterium]|jgi:hypothetical protein
MSSTKKIKGGVFIIMIIDHIRIKKAINMIAILAMAIVSMMRVTTTVDIANTVSTINMIVIMVTVIITGGVGAMSEIT